jgi:hypothetical protein
MEKAGSGKQSEEEEESEAEGFMRQSLVAMLRNLPRALRAAYKTFLSELSKKPDNLRLPEFKGRRFRD